MRDETWRRWWHTGGGLVLPVLAWCVPRWAVLCVAACAAGAAVGFELLRRAAPSLNAWAFRRLSRFFRPGERTSITGSTYLLVGSLLTLALFRREIAVPALVFLAVGDPIAATVGRKFGRLRFWGKTVEGTLAGLVACLAAGEVMLLLGLPLGRGVVAIGAVTAVVVELCPLPVNDNVLIPLVSGAVMAALALCW